MELCSLHPFDEATVRDFMRRALDAAQPGTPEVMAARAALGSLERHEERGRYELTHALGRYLAAHHPSFSDQGLSLTGWEARIDRGAGMLMRPPARLMIDAGFDPALARLLPIRLELSRGMMGGAYIPARLVSDLERLLDTRLERTIRRLIEAELPAVDVLGLMMETAAYARENGLGIFEAMDVVGPDGDVPGGRVIRADRKRLDKALRARMEEAAKPPKKPGLWARLTKRAKPETYGFPEDAGQ
ncbi:MAG: hypothetical protein IT336_08640 [Thermomicrobiales bacterium]|nr:hypothetical protein [Thermomicrobiales bacterium]